MKSAAAAANAVALDIIDRLGPKCYKIFVMNVAALFAMAAAVRRPCSLT